MTKYIVNNRTDALKTDINLFFYDNKLSNCPLSLADASHEFQIHVSVRILTTVKINQWARVNFCSYRKKNFLLVTGRPRVYLSLNRCVITWVSNYRCPFNGFLRNVFHSFQHLAKALQTFSLNRSSQKTFLIPKFVIDTIISNRPIT